VSKLREHNLSHQVLILPGVPFKITLLDTGFVAKRSNNSLLPAHVGSRSIINSPDPKPLVVGADVVGFLLEKGSRDRGVTYQGSTRRDW